MQTCIRFLCRTHLNRLCLRKKNSQPVQIPDLSDWLLIVIHFSLIEEDWRMEDNLPEPLINLLNLLL